jgi:8-oxo-dGTP pyrophosphatase MutT (NUDIX family)
VTIEDEIRHRLQGPLPGADTHLKFAPTPRSKSWDPGAYPPHARRAATLLLIYPGPHGPSIVLTRRRADLPDHAGQISLPGGGIDAGESPEQAAIREAHEEIGVPSSAIRLIGSLSTLWVIVSGFVVHPIVAIADTRPEFAPSPREVDTIIEAPVAALRDPSVVKWGRRVREGLVVACPYFAVDGHYVWGATAMMLGEFCTALDPAFSPPPVPVGRDLDALPILG